MESITQGISYTGGAVIFARTFLNHHLDVLAVLAALPVLATVVVALHLCLAGPPVAYVTVVICQGISALPHSA